MIKVVETYNYDSEDYTESLKIEVFEDEQRIKRLNFHDGEPEDNSIGRNFSDVNNIVGLMKLAYKAGKEGKELVFDYINESEEEL